MIEATAIVIALVVVVALVVNHIGNRGEDRSRLDEFRSTADVARTEGNRLPGGGGVRRKPVPPPNIRVNELTGEETPVLEQPSVRGDPELIPW